VSDAKLGELLKFIRFGRNFCPGQDDKAVLRSCEIRRLCRVSSERKAETIDSGAMEKIVDGEVMSPARRSEQSRRQDQRCRLFGGPGEEKLRAAGEPGGVCERDSWKAKAG